MNYFKQYGVGTCENLKNWGLGVRNQFSEIDRNQEKNSSKNRITEASDCFISKCRDIKKDSSEL